MAVEPIKTTELDEATDVVRTDEFVMNVSGHTRRVPVGDVLNDTLLDQANTFTVAPQTIEIDDDAHAGVVIKVHSSTQSAKPFYIATSAGSFLAGFHPKGWIETQEVKIWPVGGTGTECEFITGMTDGLRFTASHSGSQCTFGVNLSGGTFELVLSAPSSATTKLSVRYGGYTGVVEMHSAGEFRIGGGSGLPVVHIPGSSSTIGEITRGISGQTAPLKQLQGKSSTTDGRPMADIDATWTVTTDATRTSELNLRTVTNGGSLVEVGRFDGGGGASPASGNTGLMLWDVDNGTLERVTVGAADSGGTGYKVLRIPN